MRYVLYTELRGDWYQNNSVLPGLARRCVKDQTSHCFIGFPQQWIPIFEYLGLIWKNSIVPAVYCPFFSDLKEQDVLRIVQNARQENRLRTLVESTSHLDPVLSDFLYIVDNTLEYENLVALRKKESLIPGQGRTITLNGWQSYGRASIRLLEEAMLAVSTPFVQALALPCALKRPYNKSPTHRKIYNRLREQGYEIKRYHRLVITAIGILPEELWERPEVLAYDAGVPDIYRILRLGRAFFKKTRYNLVIDCLQFEPYSDVLRILHREGCIERLDRIKTGRKRHFYIRS